MSGHVCAFFIDNIDTVNSCISELQSMSHGLYHQAMMDNTPQKNCKSLMQMSQKIDEIVLKLNNMEQSMSSDYQQATMETWHEIKDKPIDESTEIKDTSVIIEEEDDFVVTQEDVDEINREMEDLFGSPISMPKI